MDFEDFCANLLRASKESNFAAFLELMESNWVYTPRLYEVFDKNSLDTVPHFAAASGCIDILRYLDNFAYYQRLLAKENVDGKTPLHVSVQFGHLECVQLLLLSSVPVDALKKGDWTPLMLSCTRNNAEIVKELLIAGANPRLVNKDGWNSLHIACREGCSDVISCLLISDPLVWKTKSRNGRTPLHTAALHGQINAVQLLLMYGKYPPDEADSCGITPLMDAATANNVPIIKLLNRSQKASPYAMDMLGRNSLHMAAQAGSLDVITYLLKQCQMEIDKKTSRNETPRDFALKENQMKAVQLLDFLKNEQKYG